MTLTGRVIADVVSSCRKARVKERCRTLGESVELLLPLVQASAFSVKHCAQVNLMIGNLCKARELYTKNPSVPRTGVRNGPRPWSRSASSRTRSTACSRPG